MEPERRNIVVTSGNVYFKSLTSCQLVEFGNVWELGIREVLEFCEELMTLNASQRSEEYTSHTHVNIKDRVR